MTQIIKEFLEVNSNGQVIIGVDSIGKEELLSFLSLTFETKVRRRIFSPNIKDCGKSTKTLGY
jgi:hypothetical protein